MSKIDFFFKILITASLFIFIYIGFRSEIVWQGLKRDYYLYPLILSLFLIFFFIFALYLNKQLKIYSLIVFISLISALYLFEGYLAIINYKNKETKILNHDQLFLKKKELYKKKTGLEYDTRTKLEVYLELRKTEENIVVPVHPRLYIYDFLEKKNLGIVPLSGISNSKTLYCNELGYYSDYLSDRYGFNNPDAEWDQSEVEYVLVGDSYTLGACVHRPHDMASVLRTLTKKPVLNLGYGGNGELLKYATLREYLNPNVKKILWMFMEGNDLLDMQNELKSPILKNYITNKNYTQNLINRQKEIDEIATKSINQTINKEAEDQKNKNIEYKNIQQKIKDIKFFTKSKNFVKLYNTRSQLFKPKNVIPKEFEYNLRMTNELAKANNSELYFVYLPIHHRYSKNISNIAYNFDYSIYEKIKQIVERNEIPFVDIPRKVFDLEDDPLNLIPFKIDGHYNIEGYKKIALEIYKKTSNK